MDSNIYYSSSEEDSCQNIQVGKRRRDDHTAKELLTCGKCETLLTTKAGFITCDCCGILFCQDCSKLPKKVYRHLVVNNIASVTFNCKSCKRIQPTLKNIDDSMKALNISNEKRIRGIDTRISKLETDTTRRISQEIKNNHRRV
ncbi:hypothetical protein KP79_PYT24533 [Mizuhopecten yessoensis]|uniref:Uncharacterized protein n=1 Tax=Mizuhopecten yessoensis TaxID=6573 RepID=A0A210Q280_MIZYE|nr:hypothetical protein KP79_PYT24533 [Mizuhopecten yessoensis]